MLPDYCRVKLKTNRFEKEGIVSGAIGYVIENYNDGNYEVEFSNKEGVSIAQIVVPESDLDLAESTE